MEDQGQGPQDAPQIMVQGQQPRGLGTHCASHSLLALVCDRACVTSVIFVEIIN